MGTRLFDQQELCFREAVVPVNESNELFHGKQIVRKRFAGRTGRTKDMVETRGKFA